jgi:hypothetical protein
MRRIYALTDDSTSGEPRVQRDGHPSVQKPATDADVLAMVARAAAQTISELMANRIEALRQTVGEQEALFSRLPQNPECAAILDHFHVTRMLLGQIEIDLRQFVGNSAGAGETSGSDR